MTKKISCTATSGHGPVMTISSWVYSDPSEQFFTTASEDAYAKMGVSIGSVTITDVEDVKTYNHAFSLGFEVKGSVSPDGDDITPEQYKQALLQRIQDLDANQEWFQAVGTPFNTMEEQS